MELMKTFRFFSLLSMVSCALLSTQAQEIRHFYTPALQSFSNKLATLSGDRLESLLIGVDTYKDLFKDASPEVADSAYVLLEDFTVLNLQNTEFNLILLQAGNADRQEAEQQAAQNYERLLYNNYFSVNRSQGYITVEPDLARIQNELQSYLSPRTYAFFTAVQQENQNGESTDITEIEPLELARRACFWDNFLNNGSDFLYREEAVQRRDAYLEQLVFGSDNHPLFMPDRNLDTAYRKAYLYIMGNENAVQQGKTATVIRDFWKVLERNAWRDKPEVWMFTY